jgi:hypothetical protein
LLRKAKQVKEAVAKIKAMQDCPVCMAHRKAILEHQERGHKDV